MVKGFWRNSRGSRHCGVQKRTAGKPTRQRLTVATDETFKNIFRFLEVESDRGTRQQRSRWDGTGELPAAWCPHRATPGRRALRTADRPGSQRLAQADAPG